MEAHEVECSIWFEIVTLAGGLRWPGGDGNANKRDDGRAKHFVQHRRLLAPLCRPNWLEKSAAAKTPVNFEIADIHPSPRRRYPSFEGAFLQDGRYMLRQATMADLIATAYGLKDSSYARGGPTWLEWDRWDVIGKVPPGTSEATAKQMLQSLLAQRFALVVHTGTAPMPVWVLRAGKDTSKLKHSPARAISSVRRRLIHHTLRPTSVVQITVQCTNMTMDQFAERFQEMAGGYLDKPVVNSTGLEGQYDLVCIGPHAGACPTPAPTAFRSSMR